MGRGPEHGALGRVGPGMGHADVRLLRGVQRENAIEREKARKRYRTRIINALHTACDQLALFCIAQKWVVALERVLWEELVLEWATWMLDFCEECSEKTLYNEK
jgi:hypothetical protein